MSSGLVKLAACAESSAQRVRGEALTLLDATSSCLKGITALSLIGSDPHLAWITLEVKG